MLVLTLGKWFIANETFLEAVKLCRLTFLGEGSEWIEEEVFELEGSMISSKEWADEEDESFNEKEGSPNDA